ncbi:hypothetical protein [Luteimonas sp. 100069]|uniref:hypothetical protein n=1 Tax=Luteimonas sp. 100069 TaxID=2006109 RepID=UPI000F4F6817|nr:hypothetical protein [Luteimonas sp. 100069]RPD87717.1 hypothetical protein EGK76_00455 [Luteimonas sp. 100069]
MLLRALVVLLVILNLGVAAWWSLRAAAVEVVAADTAESTLQLAREVAGPGSAGSDRGEAQGAVSAGGKALEPAVTRMSAASPNAPVSPRPADPPQCATLGPFDTAAARDAALQRIAPDVVRVASREVGDASRGWRVWMAPLPDRAAAGQMVARLLEAGFNDYYIIADGPEANAIALGRFGGESGARARAQALRAAGFEVVAMPIPNPQQRHWIDAMLADSDTTASLRDRAGAPRVEPHACNPKWDAG